MTKRFADSLVVPVANDTDARETARVLSEYEYEQVTVVHVIEKGEGVPDKLPVEQARRRAEEAFTAFRDVAPEADAEIVYGRDVVDAIRDVATDVGASAIAFRPRGGNRLVQLLSGDTASRLLTETDRPVIGLPEDRA